MKKIKFKKSVPFIIVLLLIIVLFLYLNNKIDNLDLIKEERIVMTNNFSQNVEKVKSATVWIRAETAHKEIPFVGGEHILMDGKVVSSGSGFFVSEDGYILTAEHVVHNALDKIVVFVLNGNKLEPHSGKIISINEDADVALLKIEGKDYNYLDFEEKEIKDGMDIGFIGYPLGIQYPVTHKGILSGRISSKYPEKLNPVNIFMINAFVNSGNSGGPLFNANNGKVIGIINMRHVVVPENIYIPEIPPEFGSGSSVYINGVNPTELNKFTIENRKLMIDLARQSSQVGIGYSSSVEYGKELLEATR